MNTDLESKIDLLVWDSVWKSVYGSVHDSVGISVWNSVWNSVHGSVENTNGSILNPLWETLNEYKFKK